MYRGPYTLIGSELSMFTRKLEAQLRYQGIPYRWLFKTTERTPELEARAKTRFIPLLQTPDGWLIHDTIAIGPMLSERFSDVPVIPPTAAQRSACFILEDTFNHWLARHALHTRWCYPEDVRSAGLGFGANMLFDQSQEVPLTAEQTAQLEEFGPMMASSFGTFACSVQGAGIDQAPAIRHDLEHLMSLLSTHLDAHDFLLGGRACLADFILVGVAVGHFLRDPKPREWLGDSLPMLEAYVERVWSPESYGDWVPDDVLPPTLFPFFEHAQTTYQRFALASIHAAARGDKTFELDLGYGPFQARSMKRLEKARLHVRDVLNRCQADQTELAKSGVLEFYAHPPLLPPRV